MMWMQITLINLLSFNMTLFSAGAPAPTKNDVNPLAYTLEVIGGSAKVNGALTSATALVIEIIRVLFLWGM